MKPLLERKEAPEPNAWQRLGFLMAMRMLWIIDRVYDGAGTLFKPRNEPAHLTMHVQNRALLEVQPTPWYW